MRDDKLYIQDILKEIDYLLKVTSELSYEQFLNDETYIRAAERSIEIIGEAASKISATLKSSNKKIQWQLMKDMRNIIAHDYFQVDYSILWETILYDLPTTRDDLDQLLKSI
ncbi:MAG: DUF86 domain-containing protein [bacterium]|nr:DUF86 domain-containing protein [bacterium]